MQVIYDKADVIKENWSSLSLSRILSIERAGSLSNYMRFFADIYIFSRTSGFEVLLIVTDVQQWWLLLDLLDVLPYIDPNIY